MSDTDVWETVPAAARRMGIGERKAYRYAAKLSDSDLKLSDTGTRLVRRSAMNCLTDAPGKERKAPIREASAAAAVSDSGGEVSDTLSDSGPKVSDMMTTTQDGTLAARVYQERVVGLKAVNAEQAQRVADLQGRVEALEADKKELYAVLQREQTLRSLPAPAGDDAKQFELCRRRHNVRWWVRLFGKRG